MMHFLKFPVATLQTFVPPSITIIILYVRNNALEEIGQLFRREARKELAQLETVSCHC